MIKFKAKEANGTIIKSSLSEFTFPAGEVHIKREERRQLEPVEIAVVYGSAQDMHNDLFKVMMWSNYLTYTASNTKQVLVMPYYPGARADRGEPFGAQVYASFLNQTAIDQVIIFDPHSEVIVEELSKPYDLDVRVLTPKDLFSRPFYSPYTFNSTEFQGIIAPDKGAVQRASEVAEILSIPLFKGTKTRDFNTGKLTGFEIEPLNPSDNYLIVDDICDGGGTFMGLAQATNLPRKQLSLYVSHGIFSGNAVENLGNTFKNVYFTNSYRPDRMLRVFDEKLEGWKYEDIFNRIDVVEMMLATISVA